MKYDSLVKVLILAQTKKVDTFSHFIRNYPGKMSTLVFPSYSNSLDGSST